MIAQATRKRMPDGPGIQPDVRIPVFRAADIEGGRDPALEEAIKILDPVERTGNDHDL